MFVEFRDAWPPPEPWEPEKPAPRLTKGGERVVGWIVGLNLLLLVVGPLAGVTIFDAVAAMLRQ